ncbi:MAG: uroporphyrinogen-III synthase, partial [Candidatus Nanopelagicales bacterium]
ALTLPAPGWPPPLVPAVATVTGLVAALSHVQPGLAIAPLSAIAGPVLAESLAQLGWAVVARAVYETIIVRQRPSSADAVTNGLVAAVVMRSPSAVEALLHHAAPAPGVHLIAAGPTTARALALHGLACVQASGSSPAEVAATCAMTVRR